MTREERDKAIRILQWLHNNNFLFRSTEEDVKFATEYAIEALEQEPCEDAVSRQAVIDKSWELVYPDGTSERVVSVKDIEVLPSVNPQKAGHWIADVDKWGDVVTTVNGYRCDKCNTFNADKDNYCPYCGAKMVEPQESEE